MELHKIHLFLYGLNIRHETYVTLSNKFIHSNEFVDLALTQNELFLNGIFYLLCFKATPIN